LLPPGKETIVKRVREANVRIPKLGTVEVRALDVPTDVDTWAAGR
jgi:gamma-glutamyl:cysteine ligase YbdK (ATP-grasp superfamily)